jgi:hypothetical protein
MRNLGFVLIALAVMVFLYQGVTTTRREKVLGLGFAESVKTPEKNLPLFPFWAGWTLVGGTFLIAVNEKRFENRKTQTE